MEGVRMFRVSHRDVIGITLTGPETGLIFARKIFTDITPFQGKIRKK